MISRSKQRGYLLVTVIITLFLLASIAVLLSHDSAISANTSSRELESARVEYVAAAGLQTALWRAQNNACMGDVTIPDTAFGNDKYSAAITGAAAGTLYELTADQDAWIRDDQPTNNNGGDSNLHIKDSQVEQPLYRFDLSSLPAGAQINYAAASFYVSGEHPEGPVTVHRITSEWNEGDVTWDSISGSVDSEVLAMIPAQPNGGVRVHVNITGQVQAWVNGEPNNGILLASSAPGIHAQYVSREGAAGQHPQLEVVVGSGTASPVTINASGTLDNGVSRTLKNNIATAYQPPTVTVLQPGAEGKDGAVRSANPNNNFGTAIEIRVTGGADPEHALIQFPVEKIPAGSRIASARMEVYLTSMGSSDPAGEFSVHPMNEAWTEGTGDSWNPGDGAPNPWSTADGSRAWDWQTNHDVANPVDTTVVDPSYSGWHSWDIAELAQQWLSGGRENFGVVIKGNANVANAWFRSSDYSDPLYHPRLIVEYACECGNSCMAPQGSGNVLMPVTSTSNPTPGELHRIAMLESWGYVVDTTWEKNSQSNFNSAIAANDVVYVPATVDPSNIGSKLTGAPVGIVSEHVGLNNEFGIAAGGATPVDDALDIVDTSHYITRVFPPGSLPFKTVDTALASTSGSKSPDAQVLATAKGQDALVALESGGISTKGGSVTARRVLVPVGDSDISTNYLTNSGHLVVQRSLAWAMGAGKTEAGKLLLVVSDAANPVTKDADRKALFESWGYTVSLIDDGTSQTDLNTAAAANDVVYVSASIGGGTLADKLTTSTAAIVNEFYGKLDNFGFSSDTDITVTANLLTTTDAAHYISELFSGAGITQFTSNITMPVPAGTLAPDMQAPGLIGVQQMLATLDDGAERWDNTPSPGRRVHLPFGAANISQLTDDGKTLMRRSIEWAAGAGPKFLPIAHWKLNDGTGLTAIDSEGGHDGTLTNDPAWTSGQLAGGLDFDENDDYVDLGSNAELVDIFDGGATVTGWIYPRSWGESDNGRILDKASQISGDRDGWMIAVQGANPSVQFAQGFTGVRGFWRSQAGTVSLNEWVHFAVVYDASSVANDAEIYLDGVKQSPLVEITPTGTIATDAGISMRMGNYAQDTSRTFDGIIDDVRIYERMLSDTEIAELAVPPSTLPIAHWKLDDGTGLAAVDSEGGHDGTLTNGPTWVAGQLGDALEFDGGTAYVDLTSDAELDDIFLSGATVMAWINPDDWGDNGYGRIFDKSTSPSSTGDGWAIRLNKDNDGLNLGQGFTSGRGWWRFAENSIILDSWQHVAVAYDASSTSNDPIVYLNGSPVAVTRVDAPSGSIRSDAAINLRLGNHAGGTDHTFKGVIDDARIYDRILSAAEIAALAGGGGGGGGGGGCDGNYRDEFGAVSFGNSDGTLSWSGDWLEVGESDGPSANDVRVRDDNGPYQLWIRDNNNGGEGVEREADLSGASSATLSFIYRRSLLDDQNDYVKLEISSNGTAGPWSELGRIDGPGTDSTYSPFEIDISEHASANTRIRLISSPTMGNTDLVIFDDIDITCTP